MASRGHSEPSDRKVVKVVSFGFKQGNPPHANMLMDVRFLKNPYWVEELRALTGLDFRVRNYVMEQEQAKDFLARLMELVSQVLPAMFSTKTAVFTVALGCTGGQHRSVSVAEALAQSLRETYPEYDVHVSHREIDHHKSESFDVVHHYSEGGVQ